MKYQQNIIRIVPSPNQNFGGFIVLRTVMVKCFISLGKSLKLKNQICQNGLPLGRSYTLTYLLFLCKPSEKARAKVRNSIVCQWLPVVILLLTRRLLCFYSKILFPVSVHLSKRLLFLNKRGLSTAFTSDVTGENTQSRTRHQNLKDTKFNTNPSSR